MNVQKLIANFNQLNLGFQIGLKGFARFSFLFTFGVGYRCRCWLLRLQRVRVCQRWKRRRKMPTKCWQHFFDSMFRKQRSARNKKSNGTGNQSERIEFVILNSFEANADPGSSICAATWFLLVSSGRSLDGSSSSVATHNLTRSTRLRFSGRLQFGCFGAPWAPEIAFVPVFHSESEASKKRTDGLHCQSHPTLSMARISRPRMVWTQASEAYANLASYAKCAIALPNLLLFSFSNVHNSGSTFRIDGFANCFNIGRLNHSRRSAFQPNLFIAIAAFHSVNFGDCKFGVIDLAECFNPITQGWAGQPCWSLAWQDDCVVQGKMNIHKKGT